MHQESWRPINIVSQKINSFSEEIQFKECEIYRSIVYQI